MAEVNRRHVGAHREHGARGVNHTVVTSREQARRGRTERRVGQSERTRRRPDPPDVEPGMGRGLARPSDDAHAVLTFQKPADELAQLPLHATDGADVMRDEGDVQSVGRAPVAHRDEVRIDRCLRR